MQELWETWVLSLGRKMLWSRARQLTPVFLPGKSHGCRRLVGYRSWGFNRVRHNLVTKNSPLYTIYILHLLYPFLYSWRQHLGCFHFLAIVNSSPMNTGMLISFQIMFFFFSGFIPISGITGYYIQQLYFQNFKESPYTSPQWLYQFTVLPIGQKSSHLFPPSLAFIVCRFFDDGHSNRCEVKLHCNFDLHLSNNQ